MNITDLIQAISAGICFSAGITHLIIGLRSEPKDQVNLSFAVLSLLFGLYSVGLFGLYAAFDTGSLSRYVPVDKWGLALYYLAYAALFWFIGAYTGARNRSVPLVLTGLYVLIAMSNFILPYTWVYTGIELTDVFPPDIIVAPWYSVEQVITFLLTLLYSAYHINKQFRRGEKGAARALAVAVGIFLFTLLWDYGIEYGLIDTVLMTQYGFVAFIVIMSLRLSGQAVEAEQEVRLLNIELEDRVEQRTAELSEAKDSAEAAVKELQESETRLDYVLRSARLAVWEYDLQTRETAVTDMFPYLLGYDPDDLLVESDKKWRGYQLGHQSLASQLLHPDDAERYAENLGGMIEGKETFEVEHRLRMANGEFHWMRDHGKIVKWDDAGKPLLAYGVIMDIDKMKNLQLELINAKDAADEARSAAEAANRAKSVFLANMSHELRTPLNAILGFAQIMERDPSFPPKHRRNLETIDRSGEHLLDLINDVLEMSRIEAGRASLEKTGFDLYNTLDSLESIMRVRAENKGLDLVVECEDDLPRYIRADERKLRQVLINLLGNAVKFTEQGQVTLRVKREDVKRKEPDVAETIVTDHAPRITFEVEDTGVGIAPQEMDQLFDPFGQTQSGLRVGEGTGLGLPISRQFVQLMGGDINVQSTPLTSPLLGGTEGGQGSTFSFDIPLELADPLEVEPERPTQRVVGLVPNQQPAGGGSYRILVVDDSADNRALLRQLIEGVGFEVETAVDGQAAVDAHHRWGPHLIWMDIRMPGMDGYQATRQIKGSDGPETVVIAVTASAFEEERAQVLEAGCDDFVRKPFTQAEIFDKMAQHLGVRYVYEEIEPTPEESDRVVLAPADLAALPDDWLAELRQAATRGRTQHLLDLIEHIEPDHAQVATALRAMVNDLEFKQIVALTD